MQITYCWVPFRVHFWIRFGVSLGSPLGSRNGPKIDSKWTPKSIQKRLPEKEEIMKDFAEGRIDLLVATTVIEVGVNVPNASLMIVENSERLGLAQLHQLRGRVGRGADKSACILMYQSPLSESAKQRLNILRQSDDGFMIAEKDLELRGPGEILGTQQTGIADMKIANIVRDAYLLKQAGYYSLKLLEANEASQNALISRWIDEDKVDYFNA